MKIIASAEHVEIIEIDDFKKFHIEAHGELEQVVAKFIKMGAGLMMNDQHAEVSIAFIERQAGEKLQDVAWINGLKHMLDYASGKGWINQEHQAVIGHVEWVSEQDKNV